MLPDFLRTNTFEGVVALIGILSGVLFILDVYGSPALNRLLPDVLVRAWGLTVIMGACATYLGLIKSYSETQLSEFVFWQRILAWGLTLIAYSAYVYIMALCLLGNIAITAITFSAIVGLTANLKEVMIHDRVADIRLELGLNARR